MVYIFLPACACGIKKPSDLIQTIFYRDGPGVLAKILFSYFPFPLAGEGQDKGDEENSWQWVCVSPSGWAHLQVHPYRT
jgi:hypothetical protein